MKTIKKITFLFFMALAIVACSKDDDNNEETAGAGGGGEEYFRASVDGTGFTADTDLATLIGASLTTSNGMMTLVAQGSTNQGDFINFNIINYDGPGTYRTGDDLTNPNGIMYGELEGKNVSAWSSNLATAVLGTLRAGEITITTQDDNGAEGTFSFEGYNGINETTKNVTSGEFKVVFDN